MRKRTRIIQGFTLFELLITVSILGIVLGIGALNLKPLSGDLQNSTSNLAGHLKQVRARAMASTSAYRLVYVSPTQLRAEVSSKCSASSWTTDARFGFELERPVRLRAGAWNAGDAVVCYSSRGLANASPVFTLQDDKGKTRQIEVFRGGGVEVR